MIALIIVGAIIGLGVLVWSLIAIGKKHPEASKPPVLDRTIMWTASTDAVLGYYVYRNETRLTPLPINQLSYTDHGPFMSSTPDWYTVSAVATNVQGELQESVHVQAQAAA